MVQLTEVVDEHFKEGQPGPEDDDEQYSDTDSEISTESDYDTMQESLMERMAALKDIIPAPARAAVSHTVETTSGAVGRFLSVGGKTLWVVVSSVLLIGAPLSVALAEEMQVVEMEKEMKMREVGGDVLTQQTVGGSETAAQVDAILGRDPKASSAQASL